MGCGVSDVTAIEKRVGKIAFRRAAVRIYLYGTTKFDDRFVDPAGTYQGDSETRHDLRIRRLGREVRAILRDGSAEILLRQHRGAEKTMSVDVGRVERQNPAKLLGGIGPSLLIAEGAADKLPR